MDGQVDPLRMGCVNDIRLTLAKGTYRFQTFEPYVMQGLRVLVLSGACVLEDVRLREYAYPAIPALKSYRDPELQLIYDAAVRTFRQNSPDIYMDCPSRERAGWLCDSFFTSRVERILTGESRVERNFLENFLLPESFVDMPEGMLPMCYPSDPSEHQYIPNWAMWFVLELREYLDRTGDRALVDALKKRVYDLAAYFRRYENEDELLENLDGWIFLEWSRANDADVVAGVNYPTNMTYAGTLRAIGELYGDGELVEKADRIIETVRRQSYDADKGFSPTMRCAGTAGLRVPASPPRCASITPSSSARVRRNFIPNYGDGLPRISAPSAKRRIPGLRWTLRICSSATICGWMCCCGMGCMTGCWRS